MELLAVVALILALGVGARVLSDRLRIPSVLFLIVAGAAAAETATRNGYTVSRTWRVV